MTLVGTLLAFILPVRYTATTSILPPQQGSSAGSALLAQLSALNPLASVASGGTLGLKNPSDLQVALLKSRTVEDAMLVRFHLMELYHKKRASDARTKLEKIIDIETSAKDPLIRISATDPDPQRATDLANGYVEEFKRLSATLAVSEASQRRVFFEDQLSQAKDNLANAEEDLKRTEQKTGLIQLDSQARAAIESVATLRAQVTAKEVQISAIRLYATGENPQLTAAEQELATLQAELAKIGSSAQGTAPPLLGGLQQQGLEYVRKLRAVKYYETIFELLARQLEVAKVDEARQGATIQVVDKALKPDRHSSPKRTYLILGSFVLGWVFGIGWAFGSEGIRRIEQNPAERARLDALREELSSKKGNHNRAGAA
jgi:capsule polysaccharide export protein KpsE/RkpR